MQERLGVILEKEDEMDCAVSGCNFLLKAVQNEAFSYENGKADFTTEGLLLSNKTLHLQGSKSQVLYNFDDLHSSVTLILRNI